MGACCVSDELEPPGRGDKIKDLPAPSLIGLDVY